MSDFDRFVALFFCIQCLSFERDTCDPAWRLIRKTTGLFSNSISPTSILLGGGIKIPILMGVGSTGSSAHRSTSHPAAPWRFLPGRWSAVAYRRPRRSETKREAYPRRGGFTVLAGVLKEEGGVGAYSTPPEPEQDLVLWKLFHRKILLLYI